MDVRDEICSVTFATSKVSMRFICKCKMNHKKRLIPNPGISESGAGAGAVTILTFDPMIASSLRVALAQTI